MRSSLPLLALAACTAACTEPTAKPADGAACTEHAVVAALSDYTSTTLGVLGPDDVLLRDASIDFGTDPVLRRSTGQTFFLNRFDAILIPLDGQCGVPQSKILLSPPQKLWNPQDVACMPDGAMWVPFFGQPLLRMLPAGAQDGDPGVVDLSLAGYDDDGNPNASSAVHFVVDGASKIFVSLGRLEDKAGQRDTAPKAPGLLLRVDAATRAVDRTFELAGWNPFGQAQQVGELLLFTMAGRVDVADEANAGIELYDPARNVSRLVASERELGGSVAQVAVHGECGAAIVFGPQRDINPTELLTFRAPTAASLDAPVGDVLTRSILKTPGYDLQGLAWSGDTLYVGDRRKLQAGYAVHKYRLSGGTCDLHAAGSVIVPQKPVAFLPTQKATP